MALNSQCPTTATTSEEGFERLVTKGEFIADMARHETQTDNKLAMLALAAFLVRQTKAD